MEEREWKKENVEKKKKQGVTLSTNISQTFPDVKY